MERVRPRKEQAVGLSKLADAHRLERSVLLAIDRELSEGGSSGPPEFADPVLRSMPRAWDQSAGRMGVGEAPQRTAAAGLP
jgi:hypothetical protein